MRNIECNEGMKYLKPSFLFLLVVCSYTYGTSYSDLDFGYGSWSGARAKKTDANIGLGYYFNLSNGSTVLGIGPTIRATVLPYDISDPNHYAIDTIKGRTMEYGLSTQLYLGGSGFKVGTELGAAYQTTNITYSGDPAMVDQASADYTSLAVSGLVYNVGGNIVIGLSDSSFIKLFSQYHIMGSAGKLLNIGMGLKVGL